MLDPKGFFKLQVKHITQETDQAVSLHFAIPEELKSTFSYKAGQYLTLEAEIDGEPVRRAYSLCTSPYLDALLAVTIKKVDGGKMSNYINSQVQEGDLLWVMPPNGKFWVEPSADAQKTYILFGGGSGITPLMGIAKTVLSQEPKSKVFLVYANRDTQSVIFKEKWDAMQKEHPNRLKIFYSYDKPPMMWFGLKGYLTEQGVVDLLKNKVNNTWPTAQFYICGPSPMMDVVRQGLQKLNIPDTQVHTEYFSTVKKAPAAPETTEASNEPSPISGTAKVWVTVYGNTSSIEVKENQTLLEAANEAGLQPPYSCTVGVCTTCRAKVTKGKVEMLEREGLSDAEVEEGYVLTCQSIAKSSEIELIYE